MSTASISAPNTVQKAILASKRIRIAEDYAARYPLWKTGLLGDEFTMMSAHPYTAQYAIVQNIGPWAFLNLVRKFLIYQATNRIGFTKWLIGISVLIFLACCAFKIIEITQEVTGFHP